MAAICAIVNREAGRPAEGAVIEAMLAAAVEGRSTAGPEPTGGPVSGRLDAVAAGAADPLRGESDRALYRDETLLVVCDAEIFNNAEAAAAARMPLEAGEAEIIAGLYRLHGESWWEKVKGVYGVFIWDKSLGKGFAFSDRLGVRPIMVYEDAGRIVVATRLASLASLPGFDGRIENQAVFSYLFMEMIPTPFTFYKSARKLPGGHVLRISGGRAETAQVWDMRYPREKLSDRGEMEERMRDLMRKSVGRQSRYRVSSPEGLGCFLSGGTDSSLIAGLVSEINPGAAKTFSIGFDEQGYDEMGYARIASARFRTVADEYYVTCEDIVEALPLIVRAFDEPFANSSVVPTYFCAKRARETGVRAMLGGDGGDEIFGGNTRYLDNYRNFRRFSAPVEAAMAAAVAVSPRWALRGPLRKAANYLSRRDAPLHERIHAYDLSYYLGDAGNIFSPEFMRAGGPFLSPQDIARKILDKADAADELDRYLYHDLKNTLTDNDLRKVNTMTELAGVQVRYPFLDPDLLEFSGRIPVDLKVRDGQLRYLYKEAFKDILPREIIEKKKHGFGLPVVRWMLREGRLHDMLQDALFSGRLDARGIFRKGFVEGLYKRSRADKTTYFGSYLYYIFFLELWMREHVDGDGRRAAGPLAAALPGGLKTGKAD